jgi:hypothetical protein
LGRLSHTLSTSAQTTNLSSIIIIGPDPTPADTHPHTSRLATFLDPLQHLASLQNLVLLLLGPLQNPDDAATVNPVASVALGLGNLTQLRSLCVKVGVGLPNRPKHYTRRQATWDAPCWAAAVEPLCQLTSLQLQLSLRLNYEDDLQLQSLSGLRRLELQLDKDKAVESENNPQVCYVGWYG